MLALYRAGNINFPGLSDLDLLVVPRDRAFAPLMLSVMHVLPKKFHSILLHNPWIIPQQQLAIYRYSVLTNVTLVYGEPVLSPHTPSCSPENTACDVLERLYNYSVFWRQQDSLNFVDVRFCIAVCSSLRFTVKGLASQGIATDPNYAAAFDAMRESFMQDKYVSRVLGTIDYSRHVYKLCVRSVREAWGINAENREEVVSAITGGVAFSHSLNSKIIRERFHAISQYLSDLAHLKYWYGNIVPIAAYDRPKVPSWYSSMARLVRRWYAVRRVFDGSKIN